MAVERRKDNKNRVLKEGEYQRVVELMSSNGETSEAVGILLVQLLLKN